MNDVSMSSVVRHEAGTSIGGGDAAPGLAFWLALAAAPIFGAMALWSASSAASRICSAPRCKAHRR